MDKEIRESIGRIVRAKFNCGDEKGLGQMVGYCDYPTVIIERDDGSQYHWAMHMCEVVSKDDAIEYWRQRAKDAEKRLQRIADAGPSGRLEYLEGEK